jgi:hypothetical protein
MTQQTNIECCPKFDPAPWDGKILEWNQKKFIKDKVLTFLFMPLNFGSVMKRMMAKVEATGTKPADYLCLSDHVSQWKMDVYLAVDQEISGAENTTLSGKYFCKVYEGNFKDTGKWCKDYAEVAKGKGLEIKKMYMWYTTCPKCAKKYGKNYTVIVGQI